MVEVPDCKYLSLIMGSEKLKKDLNLLYVVVAIAAVKEVV
jgi:hypothetical protein